MRNVMLFLALLTSCGGSRTPIETPAPIGPVGSVPAESATPGAPESAGGATTECLRPSLAVGEAGRCGQGECSVLEGFPALSADGRQLAAVTKVPLVLYGPGTIVESSLRFDLIDGATATPTKSVELVTESEVSHALRGVLTPCCDPAGEESCDEYLCDPDPELVALNDAEMRSRLGERMSHVSELLEGGYCAMTPLPNERDDGADQSDLVLRSSTDYGEYDGEPTAYISIVDRASGTVRAESSRPLDCGEDCSLEGANAWLDASRSVAFITISAASEQTRQSEVAYIILEL